MTPKELVTVNEMLKDVLALSDALRDMASTASFLNHYEKVPYVEASQMVIELHDNLQERWEKCQSEMFSAESP